MKASNDTALAEKSLRRLLFVSGLNGVSVAITALLFSVVCLFFCDWIGALIGLAAAGSGVLELQGRRQLKTDLSTAKRYLMLSQAWLFCIILAYAGAQLMSVHSVMGSLTPEIRLVLDHLISIDTLAFEAMVNKIYQLIYLTVIATAFCYQGGLLLFYKKSVSKLVSQS